MDKVLRVTEISWLWQSYSLGVWISSDFVTAYQVSCQIDLDMSDTSQEFIDYQTTFYNT